MLEIAGTTLARLGLPTERQPSSTVLMGQQPGEHGTFTVVVRSREAQSQLLIYALSPSMVPKTRRADVGEFLHRANFGMHLGNFELNLETGEVRYKAATDVSGGSLSPQAVEALATAAVVSIDRYEPGLIAVIEAKRTPAEAVAMVEGG